jgi:hypothetical protein
LSLFAIDKSEDILRVCFLNKNEMNIKIDIESDLFKNRKLSEATAFVLTNQGNGNDSKKVELLKHSESGISFVAPDISVTMLTFKKK